MFRYNEASCRACGTSETRKKRKEHGLKDRSTFRRVTDAAFVLSVAHPRSRSTRAWAACISQARSQNFYVMEIYTMHPLTRITVLVDGIFAFAFWHCCAAEFSQDRRNSAEWARSGRRRVSLSYRLLTVMTASEHPAPPQALVEALRRANVPLETYADACAACNEPCDDDHDDLAYPSG